MKQNQLLSLLGHRNLPSVSLFLSTHKAGREIRQDPIRLKNLIQDAREQLEALAIDKSRVDALFEPLNPWFQGEHFWRHQSLGLSVFLSTGGMRYIKTPFELEELAVVSERFYIRPLLPLFWENGRFYVLALHQGGAHLFQGDRFEFRELTGTELPSGLTEIVEKTQLEANVGFHSSGAIGPQGGPHRVQFHSLGESPKDYLQRELEHYVRDVAHVVDEFFKAENAPLILVADDRFQGLYRRNSHYEHLVEKGVHHHPADMSSEDIHTQAWSVIEPMAMAKKDAALARFMALYNDSDPRADRHLQSILQAVLEGRVETIFIGEGRHVWGRFHDEYNVPHIHSHHESGDEDLLDLVAALTIQKGGAAYPVRAETLPQEGPVAAIYRY